MADEVLAPTPGPCPKGHTPGTFSECFAPFRYCPEKGCGRSERDDRPHQPDPVDPRDRAVEAAACAINERTGRTPIYPDLRRAVDAAWPLAEAAALERAERELRAEMLRVEACNALAWLTAKVRTGWSIGFTQAADFVASLRTKEGERATGLRCTCGPAGDGGPDYNMDPLLDCPRHGPGGPESQFGPRCPFVATTGRGDDQEPEWCCILPQDHAGPCAPTEALSIEWQAVEDEALDRAERESGAYTAREPRADRSREGEVDG